MTDKKNIISNRCKVYRFTLSLKRNDTNSLRGNNRCKPTLHHFTHTTLVKK